MELSIMNLKEIRQKYFGNLEAGNGKSLYRQLGDCLEVLLEDMPHRSEFPPERMLADELGVNRNTLRRAIKPYVNAGILRRSNKGTFVCKEEPPGMAGHEEEPVHPFVLSRFPFVNTVPVKLTVLLYENMPVQKAFWLAVREFEEQHNIQLELKWLPLNCLTTRAYHQYIEETKPDIFQLRGYSSRLEQELPLLQAPPAVVTARLLKDEYRCREYFEFEDRILHMAVPLAFNPLIESVNPELAKQTGINLDGFREGYSLRNCIDDAARLLPKDYFLSLHTDSLAAFRMYPHEITMKNVERYIRNCLERVSHLMPRGEELLYLKANETFNWFAAKSHQVFNSGKMLHTVSATYFSVYHEVSLPFHPVYALTGYPEPGCYTMNMASGLGVYRESRNSDEVASFLLFLISEDVQRRLAQCGSVPMHRGAEEALIQRFELDVGAASRVLSSCREASNSHFEHFWGGNWSLQESYLALFENPAGFERICRAACDSFQQSIGKKAEPLMI